jgi:hypothetical protein
MLEFVVNLFAVFIDAQRNDMDMFSFNIARAIAGRDKCRPCNDEKTGLQKFIYEKPRKSHPHT